MTAILFMSVFFLGLGFFISKFFKGLHPLKMIFGFAFGLPVIGALLDLDSTYYTTLFMIGMLFNYGNPFGRLFSAYDDFQLNRMYKKSLNHQRDSIQQDLDDKIGSASEHFRQKEDDIRRQEEELRRKQREFERNSSNGRNNDEYRHDNRTAMEILGLRAGFTLDDLKKAYKRESLKYHPDKIRHKPQHIKKMMEEEYKKVMNAYSELKE